MAFFHSWRYSHHFDPWDNYMFLKQSWLDEADPALLKQMLILPFLNRCCPLVPQLWMSQAKLIVRRHLRNSCKSLVNTPNFKNRSPPSIERVQRKKLQQWENNRNNMLSFWKKVRIVQLPQRQHKRLEDYNKIWIDVN